MLDRIRLRSFLRVKDSKLLVTRWISSLHKTKALLISDLVKERCVTLLSQHCRAYSIDYYKVLGVNRKATRGEIKIKYYEKCKKLHPDSPNSTEADKEEFLRIKAAYDVLSNRKTRSKYDQYCMSPDKQSKSYDEWSKHHQGTPRPYGNVNTANVHGFDVKGDPVQGVQSKSFVFDMAVIVLALGGFLFLVNHEINMSKLGFHTISNQLRGYGYTRSAESYVDQRLMERYHYSQVMKKENEVPHREKLVTSETFTEPKPKRKKKKKSRNKDNTAEEEKKLEDKRRQKEEQDVKELYLRTLPLVMPSITPHPSTDEIPTPLPVVMPSFTPSELESLNKLAKSGPCTCCDPNRPSLDSDDLSWESTQEPFEESLVEKTINDLKPQVEAILLDNLPVAAPTNDPSLVCSSGGVDIVDLKTW